MLTLNEDYDYVRAIDYSNFNNSLFSASDNGIVKKWDINIGGIISE
jgi:WD40 repeat protein